jgi:peptidoglycan/LPS O-acetylase OafA/YrhL
MKLKYVFIASAVVSGLLGLGLLLAPGPLMAARTGQAPDELTAHVAAEFGVGLLAAAVISWMTREAPDSPARNAIVTGLTLLYVLLPLGTLASIAKGLESAEGLVLVALMGLLGAGFVLIGRPRLFRRAESQ